jgi:predicted metal-dependent enzyme (double-stranded beta helix superfamily)
VKAGDISICLADDIHCVTNRGDSISLSLHTYGKHINYTGRSEFDLETNSEMPMMVSLEE